MYTPFENLPPEAKVWIYLSTKEFTEAEKTELEASLREFCEKWTRHGEDLKASYTLKYNRFIILGVDESYHEISGCAINKSIKLVQKIEKKYQVELMNRLQTAFKQNDAIEVVPLPQFKELATQGKVNGQTTVYNNLATTKAAFEQQWEIPASQSWHAKYLN